MSKIDEKLGEVIEKLTKLAEKHGEWAVDLAVNVAQVNSISALVGGAIGVIVAVGFGIAGAKLIRHAWANLDEIDWPKMPHAMIGCILAVGAGLVGLAAVLELVSVWNWTGVFNPKLALAKQFMKAAGL